MDLNRALICLVGILVVTLREDHWLNTTVAFLFLVGLLFFFWRWLWPLLERSSWAAKRSQD